MIRGELGSGRKGFKKRNVGARGFVDSIPTTEQEEGMRRLNGRRTGGWSGQSRMQGRTEGARERRKDSTEADKLPRRG